MIHAADEAEVSFWEAIADARDDDLPKLVFADRLDERGDSRGACLRWLVREHKRPAFDALDTKTWDWWSRRPAAPEHYPTSSPAEYVVPLNLFTRLRPYGGVWKANATYIAAVQNLCAAWQKCVDDGADPLAGDRPRGIPAT